MGCRRGDVRCGTVGRNVQVYADTLERSADPYWIAVDTFPSMTLRWADRVDFRSGALPWLPHDEYRRCDLGHIVDPARRDDYGLHGELNPHLGLPLPDTVDPRGPKAGGR